MLTGQLVLFAPKPVQKMEEEQRVREVQRINSQVIFFGAQPSLDLKFSVRHFRHCTLYFFLPPSLLTLLLLTSLFVSLVGNMLGVWSAGNMTRMDHDNCICCQYSQWGLVFMNMYFLQY